MVFNQFYKLSQIEMPLYCKSIKKQCAFALIVAVCILFVIYLSCFNYNYT